MNYDPYQDAMAEKDCLGDLIRFVERCIQVVGQNPKTYQPKKGPPHTHPKKG